MEEPKLEIQITSTEKIKPSSPTPDNLKHFNLSIYDQLCSPVYVGVVFFYPYVVNDINSVDRHRVLKSSLSETLTRFYPLAGRTVEGELFIDCNDAGVDYVEARVAGTHLSDILHCPDPKQLYQLLPITKTTSYAEFGSGCLVRVQVNAFDCGGMGVSVCFCHKVADASTMVAFVKGWAAAARGCGDTVLPDFNLASRFPAVPFSSDVSSIELKECKSTTRRYVFSAAKIASLKVEGDSARVARGPTRIEAVTALVWKCIIEASRSKCVDSKKPKPCVMGHIMNLRKRLDPPLSEYSIGNLLGSCVIRTDDATVCEDIQLPKFVGRLREGFENVDKNYVKKLDGEDGLKIICEAAKKLGMCWNNDDEDFYLFSSCCKFPIYDADFGWGRPAWVSFADSDLKNVILLMDTKDGDGIEIWVTLPEQDMVFFEANPKLLEFASLNPSICILGEKTGVTMMRAKTILSRY